MLKGQLEERKIALEDYSLTLVSSKANMEMLIVNYFNFIFSTSNQFGILEFLSSLVGRVTNPMNEDLRKEFTTEEIHKALMQCTLPRSKGKMECH